MSPLLPTVKWAQRPNVVYLTVDVQDAKGVCWRGRGGIFSAAVFWPSQHTLQLHAASRALPPPALLVTTSASDGELSPWQLVSATPSSVGVPHTSCVAYATAVAMPFTQTHLCHLCHRRCCCRTCRTDPQIELSNDSDGKHGQLVFKSKTGGDAEYALELQLYAAVDKDKSKITITPRSVFMVLEKENAESWPRLTKESSK